MPEYLIALSIGPVQEFIAAARRTRDLWYGSHILSEISRAAASGIASFNENGRQTKLIFPSSGNITDGDSSIANIILAEYEGNSPQDCLEAGKMAARAKWEQMCDKVLKAMGGAIDQDAWNRQKDQVLELYGCWMPMCDAIPPKTSYQVTRTKLMRLLDARKNLRNFCQSHGRDQGLFKSSLDGLRESVLTPYARRQAQQNGHVRGLRLKRQEFLDIVGVVKRGSDRQSFPSVSRVAADPWLRGARQFLPHEFEAFRDKCEILNGMGVLGIIPGNDEVFPFEGGAVFSNRHAELVEESGKETGLEMLAEMRSALAPLVRGHGEPEPYLAILVADGDKVGEALGKIGNADGHRDFSNKLSEFAKNANSIVELHRGVSVYSGGDDVLAFLPLDQALECAARLRSAFSKIVMNDVTLSVGIAIGHCLENLEDLLNWGRASEKHAKKRRTGESGEDRNGLAIHLHKRGGGPIYYRTNWLEGEAPLLLIEFVEFLKGGHLPRRFASDISRLADRYSDWPTSSEEERKLLRDAIKAEAKYRFGRKAAGESKQITDSVRERIIKIIDSFNSHADLREFSALLGIAHQIRLSKSQAEALPADLAGGKPQ